jgi:hypothetical protein
LLFAFQRDLIPLLIQIQLPRLHQSRARCSSRPQLRSSFAPLSWKHK